MKKKVPILYPFLFAFYPIFYFYDQNKHEVWFSQTIIPLFFSILVTGIFFFVFHLLTRKKHKAGICVIIFLSLFFSYSTFIDELNKYKIGTLILEQDPNLFISYSILLAIVFILIKKSKKDFMSFFTKNVFKKTINYYSVAKKSKVNFRKYSKFLKRNSILKDILNDLDKIFSNIDKIRNSSDLLEILFFNFFFFFFILRELVSTNYLLINIVSCNRCRRIILC